MTENIFSGNAAKTVTVPTGFKSFSNFSSFYFSPLNFSRMIREKVNLRNVAMTACLAVFLGFSVDSVLAQETGVKINGVTWATRNVDAPGTFVTNPESYGMFYQWNRKIGWTSSNPITSSPSGHSWNQDNAEGTTWETANDPSPDGWRVPTFAEVERLLDDSKVTIEWTVQNGVEGNKFTDKANGNSIFLPAAGQRQRFGGNLEQATTDGRYWSSGTNSPNNGDYASRFGFNTGNPRMWTHTCYRAEGISVRPVKIEESSLTVLSNDNNLGNAWSMNGGVIITSTPSNTSADYSGTATLVALPQKDKVFTGWSDGNADNPRTVTVSSDTTFTANFAECKETKVLKHEDESSFKVFPNPADNTLNVELAKGVNGTLTLFDMNGKAVLSQLVSGSSVQMDISSLSAGNYVLRLVENGKASVGTQIIKH